METANHHNDSIMSPRLMDTTLCPFSTTKKSIANTYNNDSLYIGSIEKECEQSNITQCRAKLKIRKIILDSVPNCIKQATRRLLSRVGENELILDPLLKFYKNIVPTIHRLETQIDKQIQEIGRLRTLGHHPRSQRHILSENTLSKQNELQLKIQKLQAIIQQLTNGETQPRQEMGQKGRVSLARNVQSFSQIEQKTLSLALQQIAKLKEEKENYFFMVNNFKLEIQRLKEDNKKQMALLINNETVNDDVQNLKHEVEQLKRYRELFYMCREQKQQMASYQSIDNARTNNNEKQIRKLKEKLLNLSSLIGRGDFQLLENEEKDSIEKIKDELMNNQGFKKCTEQEFKMLDQYECEIDLPAKTQSKYHQELKVYYPSFFSLLTEDMKQFEVELKISFNKAVTTDLFLRIRAIFDSKYNEFAVEPEGAHSRFVDFVFGWFEKFEVNNETKRIVQHSKPRVESQYNKKNFLISLFNPKIEKLNQILTFREFLLGQSSEDEIYYYLQCRAMFFKGSQMDHVSSTSDTIVFVQHQHILKQVGILIGKYPKQVQNIIIYNINLRRKKKFNQYFIDAAFVLRTLLEVYRAYKRQKYQKMKLVTMKLQNTLGAKEIKFVYFREMIELNFPKITVNKVSFMYRETINIYRNNKIDFFGAFYAASHEKLFMHTIKEDIYNAQGNEGRSLMNISATLPSTLGLEGLSEDLKHYYGNGIDDLCSQHLLLYKMMRLLSSKYQNKDYSIRLKEKLKLSYESHLLDVKALAENMNTRDANIHKAAQHLTRAFRYRIKLYYDKFLQRINNKIEEVNNSSK